MQRKPLLVFIIITVLFISYIAFFSDFSIVSAQSYNMPDDLITEITDTGIDGSQPTSSELKMHLAIMCNDIERGNTDNQDFRSVIYSYKEFLDDPDSTQPDQIYYPKSFCIDGFDPDGLTCGNKKVVDEEDWSENEPNLTINGINLKNPKMIRFEARPNDGGGCYAFTGLEHSFYRDDESKITWNHYSEKSENTLISVNKNKFYYSVDWDQNQADCINLGGSWIENGDYDGYRCCGDDWIWVNNIPINYKPDSSPGLIPKVKDDSLCLYSDYTSEIPFGGYISGEPFELGSKSYFCDQNKFVENANHQSYDSNLESDSNDGETELGTKNSQFFFYGKAPRETDLGKWSDSNLANPLVCNAYFDNTEGQGVKFEWLSLEDAAQKNQALCELGLGYEWTGSKCCGVPELGNTVTLNECNTEIRNNPESKTCTLTFTDGSTMNTSTDLNVMIVFETKDDFGIMQIDGGEEKIAYKKKPLFFEYKLKKGPNNILLMDDSCDADECNKCFSEGVKSILINNKKEIKLLTTKENLKENLHSFMNEDSNLICENGFVQTRIHGTSNCPITHFETEITVTCDDDTNNNGQDIEIVNKPCYQLSNDPSKISNKKSYNDQEKECNSTLILNELKQIFGNSDSPMNHIAFQAMFDKKCNEQKANQGYALNRACFKGHALNNQTTISSDPDQFPDMKNIYNINGELFACKSDKYTLPTASDVTEVPKCEFKGDGDGFAICTYGNDSWQKAIGSAGDYSYDVLGYKDDQAESLEELKQGVHESTAPLGVNTQYPNECCFSNSCWTGSKCVESTSSVIYHIDENNKLTSIETPVPNQKLYMCKDGAWNSDLQIQYDWDYNTKKPWVCVQSHQCVLKTEDCPNCKKEYFDGGNGGGCTAIPGFFINDHFCQDKIWTSRTKLLASQLITIAGNNDFTLFCENFNTSLNYGKAVETVKDRINNICVLNNSGEIIIGTTFNSNNDPLILDSNIVLFDQTNGFISVILGETDITDCKNAIDTKSADKYGSYVKCKTNNNKYWYNNKTQSLIYIKSGKASITPSHDDTKIQNLLSSIKTHITANNNEFTQTNIDVFSFASQLNRIYYAKDESKITFATIEKIYDDEKDGGETSPLRNYLAVIYKNNQDVNCDKVKFAYKNAYCKKVGSDVYIIDKNIDGQFKYWTDLTAKLRYK